MDSRWSSQALLMDENIDAQESVPQKEEEKKVPKKPEASTEIQQKAQKQWEKFLREKTEKGEKMTPEDRQRVLAAIKKGEGPTIISGGSGDGKFENFDADKYKNTPFEDVARRLKEAGLNNTVTQELLDDIQRTVNTVGGAGNESLSNDFVEEFGKVQQMQNPQQPGGRDQGAQKELTPEQQIAADVATSLRETETRRERNTTNPRSIQQVATIIIKDEGEDRWGKDGTFPLLDAENHINKANFKPKTYNFKLLTLNFKL